MKQKTAVDVLLGVVGVLVAFLLVGVSQYAAQSGDVLGVFFLRGAAVLLVASVSIRQ
jgi:hypothetical protein